jgi:hypothetical protein
MIVMYRYMFGLRTEVNISVFIYSFHPLPHLSQYQHQQSRLDSGKGTSSSSSGGGGDSSVLGGRPLQRRPWPALEFVRMEGEILPAELESFDCELSEGHFLFASRKVWGRGLPRGQ